MAEKESAKIAAAELKDIEKKRNRREKARQQNFREAAGLGRSRGKRALALEDAAEAVSAGKVSKTMEDVD